MKSVIVCILLLFIADTLVSQSRDKSTNSLLYLKLDPTEIAYDFPRIGISLERINNTRSLWLAFYYGMEGLNFGAFPNYYPDPFQYWGIKAGLKRRYPDGIGEYFIGTHLVFDLTTSEIVNDVFYDLQNNDAILFDEAIFQRNRIKLLFENGYEFFPGDRFTLELSGGIGGGRIEIIYKDIQNPFLLNDVEPRHYHRKSKHKYAGVEWKFILTAGVKIGYRL